MKIAHIVSSYPPYYGGMGNVVLQIVNELGKRGHEVEVLTPLYGALPASKEEFQPEEQKQMEYARRFTPSIHYGKAARIPQVKEELDRFDLVHLHYPFFGTANMVRRWKRRNPRKPLVITYHMDTRGLGWQGLIFRYYARFWMPKILGSAERLFASSFDYLLESQAGEMYQMQKHKWMELPFGVDIDRFQPREKSIALANEFGLDPNKATLLFVGGMDQGHYFKGIPVLLSAARILYANDFPFQLILVGEGGLRSDFEARARAYGLADTVRFAGGVDDAVLPDFYNLADLCVLPSIHRGEAFGMVLLEAMASGVPVIASDLPGVRTVAKDGGMTVLPNSPEDLAEAIVGYFSPANNQDEWRRRARIAAETKYAWGPIIDQLEGVYRELVGKK